MTQQEYNELSNKYDSLKGCINRMFVTNDYGEFEYMYSFAKGYIDEIYAELGNIKFNNIED